MAVEVVCSGERGTMEKELYYRHKRGYSVSVSLMQALTILECFWAYLQRYKNAKTTPACTAKIEIIRNILYLHVQDGKLYLQAWREIEQK